MRLSMINCSDSYCGTKTPRILASKKLFTTGYWYVRSCQAVLNAQDRTGVLSRPFVDLPTQLRDRAILAVLELPTEIGMVSLRELGPSIARLRQHHQLNILNIEALAAASHLNATVFVSAPSPLLQNALAQERGKFKVASRSQSTTLVSMRRPEESLLSTTAITSGVNLGDLV